MASLHAAVESLDEPGAAAEALHMRHILAGLLRDFEAAADRRPLAAAAPAGDDQSMADCLETAGLCDLRSADLGSTDLDALLEGEVRS